MPLPFIIIGALLIGLALGLMGSGGSILTVPILVYVLGHDGKVAIAESLAIGGGIAFVRVFSLCPLVYDELAQCPVLWDTGNARDVLRCAACSLR